MQNDLRAWMRIVEGISIPSEKLIALKAAGFDTEEILYHGSREDFEIFDVRRLRTADHFYTTPDPRTAGYYGPKIYACVGIQLPQADLLDDWDLLGKLADTFAEDHEDEVGEDEDLLAIKREIMERLQADHDAQSQEDNAEEDEGYLLPSGKRIYLDDPDDFDAEEAALDTPEYKTALRRAAKARVIDKLTSAGSDLYGMSGRFQNEVMNECFGLGYRSVRLYDMNSEGEPVSVVFRVASDIAIIGRYK